MRRIGRGIERRRQARPGDAVVLAYHRIATPESDPWRLAVSPEWFEEHVAALREHFRPISLEALADALVDGAVPRRSVVITFDDGYRDNLIAAKPVLERYGVPATVFVVTAYTEAGREFWWDELERLGCRDGRSRDELRASWRRLRELPHVRRLEELDSNPRRLELAPPPPADALPLTAEELVGLASGGLVEIGAHTATHPRLPGLSPEDQFQEILSSREFLENLLGRPVESFSYPHGEFDPITVDCVRRAGLRRACIGGQRSVTARTPPLEIPRVHVEDVPGAELVEMLESRLRG